MKIEVFQIISTFVIVYDGFLKSVNEWPKFNP